jgi:hypothetical protein
MDTDGRNRKKRTNRRDAEDTEAGRKRRPPIRYELSVVSYWEEGWVASLAIVDD